MVINVYTLNFVVFLSVYIPTYVNTTFNEFSFDGLLIVNYGSTV